jgi:hypothetical protein
MDSGTGRGATYRARKAAAGAGFSDPPEKQRVATMASTQQAVRRTVPCSEPGDVCGTEAAPGHGMLVTPDGRKQPPHLPRHQGAGSRFGWDRMGGDGMGGDAVGLRAPAVLGVVSIVARAAEGLEEPEQPEGHADVEHVGGEGLSRQDPGILVREHRCGEGESGW